MFHPDFGAAIELASARTEANECFFAQDVDTAREFGSRRPTLLLLGLSVTFVGPKGPKLQHGPLD
jgi:hypothetical protein